MKYSICQKCGSTISNSCFKRHDNSCYGQGKRIYKGGTAGGWNKGLTKDDPRVAAYAAKTSAALKGRAGHSPSAEHRKKLSESAIKRGFGGTTQSRWILYNGIKLGSSYEVLLAKDLDANGILWEKPKRFSYVDPTGKNRTYTPDFYLPGLNVYLDPKNDFLLNNPNPSLGFSDKEKIRLVEEQHSVRVIVLSKDQLTWNTIKQILPL